MFLLGMMGVGKSTVGRGLAERAGAPFIDLDLRIEALVGRSIPEIFAREGERGFRDWEGRALRSLLAEPGFRGGRAVVATGGGIVERPENLDAMLAAGWTVFLDAPPAVIGARMGPAERARRPLMSEEDPVQRLAALLRRRRPAYERCRLRVDAAAPYGEVLDATWRALSAADPGLVDSGRPDRGHAG